MSADAAVHAAATSGAASAAMPPMMLIPLSTFVGPSFVVPAPHAFVGSKPLNAFWQYMIDVALMSRRAHAGIDFSALRSTLGSPPADAGGVVGTLATGTSS